MTARAILFGVSLILAGCQDRPFVVVRVEAGPAGVPPIASLHVDLDAASRATAFDVPGPGGAVALPARFSVELPRGTRGPVRVGVTALDGMAGALAAATGAVDVTADDVFDLDLVLDGAGADDLGVPPDLVAFDAAGADLTTVDAGAAYCPAGAIFCDDFETGDTSRWPHKTVTAPATLAVDSLKPHRGAYALDARMVMNASAEPDWVGVDVPASGTLVAARAYYFATATPGNFSSIMTIDTTSGYFSAATDGSNLLTVTEQSGPDHMSAMPMPLGAWTCLELVVDRTMGGNGHVRLYADSALLVDFVPALAPAPFTTAEVGLVRASGNVDAQLFVDDFALAPAPIGCP